MLCVLSPDLSKALASHGFAAAAFCLAAFDPALFAGFDIKHTPTTFLANARSIHCTTKSLHRSFK
jgi:hypothetical protein